MDDLAVLRRQDNFSGRIFDSEQTVLLKHLNPLGRNGTSVFNLKGISGIRYCRSGCATPGRGVRHGAHKAETKKEAGQDVFN